MKTISSLERHQKNSQALSMHRGNVKAAIKLLTNNLQKGILPINKDNFDLLKQKHAKGKPAPEGVLLTDTPEEIHPVKFETILAESILKETRRGAGPSGMDDDEWR